MHRKLFSNIFNTKLQSPDIKIDIFVVINALLILGLFLLLSSKIFLPAGLGIELPNSEYIQQTLVCHTITVKSSNLLILNDRISSINALKRDLKSYDVHRKTQDYTTPILLRIDRSVTLDTIIKISNILRESGYTNIQLALNQAN